MDTNNFKTWIPRLLAAARQDPKKAGFLGLLIVLLSVLWGRMLLTGGTTAAKASVATAKVVAAPSGKSRTTDKSSTSANRAAAAAAAARAIRPSATDQRVRTWLAEPLRPVSRNLFAVKLEYFPSDGSRPSQGVKTARDGEFWGRLEKSLMLQADQRDKRENLLANYKAEAARLRLDTIIMGPQPKAMIDGKLVAEGEVVAAFRVLKIEARRIVVEREGIRLEIQMK